MHISGAGIRQSLSILDKRQFLIHIDEFVLSLLEKYSPMTNGQQETIRSILTGKYYHPNYSAFKRKNYIDGYSQFARGELKEIHGCRRFKLHIGAQF
jgi:hypothetical protein